MSPFRPARLVAVPIVLALLPVLLAPVAWAGDEPVAHAKADPGRVLAIVLLGVLFAIGVGCLVGLLRVILAGPTRKADAALARMGTGRLLLTGVLPLVGIGLLGAAAEATHVDALAIAWAVILLLPAALLALVGALAAIPHLGGALLKAREDRSLLARCVAGAVTLGLAIGATAPFPALAVVVGMLVGGWFLGAGLGIVFRPAAAAGD